ncbi:hypothetical protein D3C75_857830 [compost metagenome]
MIDRVIWMQPLSHALPAIDSLLLGLNQRNAFLGKYLRRGYPLSLCAVPETCVCHTVLILLRHRTVQPDKFHLLAGEQLRLGQLAVQVSCAIWRQGDPQANKRISIALVQRSELDPVSRDLKWLYHMQCAGELAEILPSKGIPITLKELLPLLLWQLHQPHNVIRIGLQ